MHDDTDLNDVPRRSFVIRAVTFLIALLSGLVPASIAGVFFANPLWRKQPVDILQDDAGGFTPLGIGPAAVPEDGTPIRVTVVADRVDAWNVYPSQRIGTVWLRKNESSELVALSTICPHLGCSVEYRSGDRDFRCPCHNSKFTLTGEPTNRIPPRPMDLLKTRIVDSRIWVRYEKFRGGLEETSRMSALSDWFDDRTGIRQLVRVALYERIPGGARWRYIWGSTLVFMFAVQVLTGFGLWAAYSPSVQHAWSSIFYIENFMVLGSLVRGIHHYAAQAMFVLMALHFLQVVVDGAYRAPREFNYWLGLALITIVLGSALTGYLLPWDQKGFYATQVATKIMGATPLVGPHLQALMQGGAEYGQHTLTRFFALHAGLLPAALVGCLALHITLFRRHGITVRKEFQDDQLGAFWPDQILKDALACLAVFGIVFLLAWLRPAELHAPADPAEPFAAARPEWYFLSLFRFLKFEAVEAMGLAFGAIIVPSIIFAVLFLFPLIARLPGGHTINVGFIILLASIVATLTAVAWYEDRVDTPHQAALATARRDAHRAWELANRPGRVPVEGAQALLRDDPLTRGPRLFAQHCAVCHLVNGHNGQGALLTVTDPETGGRRPALPTAADLGNLGSRAWMRAVLTDFSNHFAAVKNAQWYGNEDGLDPDDSEMADWSGDRETLVAAGNADDLNALVEFLVAQTGRADLNANSQLAERGRAIAVDGAWAGTLEGTSCTDCHDTVGDSFDPQSEGGSGYPDIAEYLSANWLRDFLAHPGDEQHYGQRNRMPSYAETLTEEELDHLVRWLSGDYYRQH